MFLTELNTYTKVYHLLWISLLLSETKVLVQKKRISKHSWSSYLLGRKNKSRSSCQGREHVASWVKQQGDRLVTRFAHPSAGATAVNKNYSLLFFFFKKVGRWGTNIGHPSIVKRKWIWPSYWNGTYNTLPSTIPFVVWIQGTRPKHCRVEKRSDPSEAPVCCLIKL